MYAVFMDYKYEGSSNTVILGGSIELGKTEANAFLRNMSNWQAMEMNDTLAWYVDEDQLPWGYQYQTYYVSPYDPKQPMIGTK